MQCLDTYCLECEEPGGHRCGLADVGDESLIEIEPLAEGEDGGSGEQVK